MKLFRTDRPKPSYWPPLTDPGDIAGALDYVRYRDPVGHRVHETLAIAICVMLPFSTALSAVTSAMAAGYAILRLPNTWRCYSPLLRMPVIWLIAAFVTWCAVSLSWSSDVNQGLDELAATRLLAAPLVLWPVIGRVHWYIGGLLAGVALQNIAQVTQGVMQLSDGSSALEDYFHGSSGRLGGWLHPIQTGAWCAAALCWHLSATLTAKPRWLRVLSLIGAAAAAFGLLATGSRGPWISAVVGVPLCLVIVAVRRPAARLGAALLAGAGVAAIIVAAVFGGDMLRERVQGAVDEYRAARERQVYWTSTGLRLALWSWASEIWQQSPIVGEGAGSFAIELQALPDYQDAVERARMAPIRELEGYDQAVDGGRPIESLRGYEQAQKAGRRLAEQYLVRSHAHSTYLHLLAATGVVGLALLVLLLAAALRRTWFDPPTHPYVDGTVAALVTWIIGAQFDCYHLNGHLIGMLAMIITFTLAHRAMGLRENAPPVRTEKAS